MRRFFYTIKQAFQQVFRNRTMSLASIFAITAMLLILSIFLILVININNAAEGVQDDYDSIEIYLSDSTSKSDAESIIKDVKTVDGVENATYKSKEDAMKKFKSRWEVSLFNTF